MTYSMAGAKALTVTYSYTHPDEPCEPSGDIFIDFNGVVTRSGSGSPSTIVLRGGKMLSKHALSDLDDSLFTLTAGQRVSLMRLLKSFASTTDRGSISSENGSLQEMCNAIYSNYCG